MCSAPDLEKRENAPIRKPMENGIPPPRELWRREESDRLQVRAEGEAMTALSKLQAGLP